MIKLKIKLIYMNSIMKKDLY